jgi:oligosaccharide repeat unit polymerase
MIIFFNIFYLCIGFLLSRKILKKYSNLLNHVSIFSVVWVFVILGCQLTKFVELEFYTLSVVYLSWYCFLFGSYIFLKNNLKKERRYSVKEVRILKRLCYILAFFSGVINLDILKDVFFNFSSFSAWAQMRNDQVFFEYRDNNILYTLFGNTSNIYIPLAIYLYVEKKIKLSMLILIYLIAILIALATFNRAPFLFLIIISLVSYSFIANKVPYKLIFSSATIMIFLFVVTSYFLNENSNNSYSSSSITFIYVFGGISAYQNLLNGKYLNVGVFDSEYYSFDFVNYILKTFKIIDTYPDLIREYDLNIMTNVYTYLDCFTLDFGIVGAFVGSFVIGYISKIIYLKYIKSGSLLYLIMYSTFCYFAAFIFMNNEYIRFGVVLFVLKIFLFIYLLKFITKEFKTVPI